MSKTKNSSENIQWGKLSNHSINVRIAEKLGYIYIGDIFNDGSKLVDSAFFGTENLRDYCNDESFLRDGIFTKKNKHSTTVWAFAKVDGERKKFQYRSSNQNRAVAIVTLMMLESGGEPEYS